MLPAAWAPLLPVAPPPPVWAPPPPAQAVLQGLGVRPPPGGPDQPASDSTSACSGGVICTPWPPATPWTRPARPSRGTPPPRHPLLCPRQPPGARPANWFCFKDKGLTYFPPQRVFLPGVSQEQQQQEAEVAPVNRLGLSLSKHGFLCLIFSSRATA